MKKKLVLMTSALMAIGLLAGCGNKHTHEWGDVSYTWAEDNSTCTATRVCKGDESHVETETVDTTSVVVTEAKCEEDGLKRYTADFKTNEAFLDQTKDVTLEAFGHEWGTPTYTWSNDYSSCTATRVCKNDSNHIESETADSAYTEIIPATCDTDGSAVYDVAFENEAFEAQSHEITLHATGHNWGEPTYVWSDDNLKCTATRVCLNDEKHTETETVDTTYSVVDEATCENDGLGRYTSAAFTNQVFSVQTKDVVIPATGHNWGEPTYVWAEDYSSCTATRVCLNDEKHTETETVETTYKVITPATCEEGLGRYTTNVFQNAAFSVQTKDVAIPANHNWGEPTYVWSEDYSSCTATRVCELDSTHVETETVNSTYKVETEATTEQEGKGVYTATFTNEAFEEQTKDVTLPKDTYATKPHLSSDGKTVTYGIYPQTNVNDSTLVSALNALTTPESNGWYLYESEYYAKVSAKPYDSSYKFDNGTTIVSGTTYWFKCEPIVWNVLSNNSGEYYIVSSVLLDAHCYYNSLSTRTIDGKKVYANNYKYSDIRTWLNADFYNSAFALGNEHIQTTTVDNSASTTNSSSNSYACANTEDKVFLPSYRDYINSSYGFSTSTGSTNTRCCKTTDWARARGAWCSTSSSYLYNGYYWTRSPRSDSSNYAWYMYFDGNLYGNYVNNTYHSVRPSLSIKIA